MVYDILQCFGGIELVLWLVSASNNEDCNTLYLSNYNIVQTGRSFPFSGQREIMLSGCCVGRSLVYIRSIGCVKFKAVKRVKAQGGRLMSIIIY